ncbi:MAG: hypothetical protein WCQ49_02575 [Candidatus Saccharibacteria bacterium]
MKRNIFSRKSANTADEDRAVAKLKVQGFMENEKSEPANYGIGQVLAFCALCKFDDMSETDKSIEIARWQVG